MLQRFIAVTAAFLLLAACGSAPEPAPGPGGPGPGGISGARFGPGSQQDLAATAGDRVFFDYDSAASIKNRRQILERVTVDRTLVMGYHMPFPGIGYVERWQDGYRWVPHSYQLSL